MTVEGIVLIALLKAQIQSALLPYQAQHSSSLGCVCCPCPSGLFDNAGGGAVGGTTRTFKATIILQECQPWPPVPGLGDGFTAGMPQSPYAVGLPPSQPSLVSPSYVEAQQQPLSQFGLGSVQQSPMVFPAAGDAQFLQQQPQLSPFANQASNVLPYSSSLTPTPMYQQQARQEQGSQSQFGSPFAPPGTLSSGYPGEAWSQQGIPQHPEQMTGYGSQQQYPISPFGMPPGSVLPSSSGQMRTDSSSPLAGNQQQPGYLPNFRGDRHTDPQRIQETRALNEPFYRSTGGEPRYPGGADNLTPSQIGGRRPSEVSRSRDLTQRK